MSQAPRLYYGRTPAGLCFLVLSVLAALLTMFFLAYAIVYPLMQFWGFPRLNSRGFEITPPFSDREVILIAVRYLLSAIPSAALAALFCYWSSHPPTVILHDAAVLVLRAGFQRHERQHQYDGTAEDRQQAIGGCGRHDRLPQRGRERPVRNQVHHRAIGLAAGLVQPVVLEGRGEPATAQGPRVQDLRPIRPVGELGRGDIEIAGAPGDEG